MLEMGVNVFYGHTARHICILKVLLTLKKVSVSAFIYLLYTSYTFSMFQKLAYLHRFVCCLKLLFRAGGALTLVPSKYTRKRVERWSWQHLAPHHPSMGDIGFQQWPTLQDCKAYLYNRLKPQYLHNAI